MSASSRIGARWSRHRADAAGVVAAVFLVGLPALLSRDGFSPDFTNHLWLVWVQDHAISATGSPTYFLHTEQSSGGVFDPFFMFYGGTLYAVTGAVSALVGHSPRVAYVAVILLSVASAYGGCVWLARQLGVRSWMAHAPAVTFVASAYYVANLYGRGAWPEFVATSALPLLVASGFRVARSERLEVLPCGLLVGATIVASGSHNITLLWAAIALLAVLALLRLFLRRPLAVGRKQVAWLLALLALGVSVNAWFLLPDIVHGGDTRIGGGATADWDLTAPLNSPFAVLRPWRWVPSFSTSPALFVQAPVWLLAWALVALALLRRGTTQTLRRAAAALGAALIALLALVLVEPLYNALPQLAAQIQYPYRLNTYVALAIAGLVLVAVLAAEAADGRVRRRLTGALGLALGISIGLCVWQLFVPQTRTETAYADLTDALVAPQLPPRTWYSGTVYLDGSQRRVWVPSHRFVTIDPLTVEGDRSTVSLQAPPGRQPFAITMGASPSVVDMHGLVRVGRTNDGFIVVRRSGAGTGPVRVTFAVRGGATTAGTAITAASVAAIAVLAALAALRGMRRRRRSERAAEGLEPGRTPA